jgi:hypothetical protein
MADEEFKLTPALRDMLERIERNSGKLLEDQIRASGGREEAKLMKLYRANLAQRVQHPTVIDRRWQCPADAVAITERGRSALSR